MHDGKRTHRDQIMIPKVITVITVIFKQCVHTMLNVFLELSYQTHQTNPLGLYQPHFTGEKTEA